MLVKGIEPPTYALRVRCSTPELHQLEADLSIKQKTLYNFETKTQALFTKPRLLISLQLALHRLKFSAAGRGFIPAVVYFK